jgi:4-hydroxy-4-methyl-2-oxoglutarate aldolase
MQVESSKKITEAIELFKVVPTCDISDAFTRLNLTAVRARGIRPLNEFAEGEPHMAGPAVTIRFLPSHYKMQYQESPFKLTEIVQNAAPGSVIAVEGGAFGKPAQGEMNGMTAQLAGAAGSVGDGAVRDIDAVRKLEMPVFYSPYPLGVTMETYVGQSHCVGVDIPIQIAGAFVRPGDILVGDNNGVVVVPLEWLDEVVEICKEIGGLESELRQRTQDGDSWQDIYKTTHKSKYAGPNDALPRTKK